MKNITNQDHYQKAFRFFLAMAKIARVLCISVFGILAVITIVLPWIPKDNMNLSLALNVGASSLRIRPELLSSQFSGLPQTFVYFTIGSVMVLLVMAYMILRCFIKVMRNVVDGKPFHADNAKSLSHMGVWFILVGVISNISSFVHVSILHMAFENLFKEAVYSFDFAGVITGVLIICLALIFQYGAFLQREYDETL